MPVMGPKGATTEESKKVAKEVIDFLQSKKHINVVSRKNRVRMDITPFFEKQREKAKQENFEKLASAIQDILTQENYDMW